MKVYCKYCEYIDLDENSECICKHAKNRISDWYSSNKLKKHPQEINKKNDCKFFQFAFNLKGTWFDS